MSRSNHVTPEWVTCIEDHQKETLRQIEAAASSLLPILNPAIEGYQHSNFASPLKRLAEALDDVSEMRLALWNVAFEQLCSRAERAFAPASGVPLEIDRDDVKRDLGVKLYGPTGDKVAALPLPALSAIWAHLENTYNTPASQEQLEAQAVTDFVSRWLDKGRGYHARDLKEPKWRKGRLVLETEIWTEKRFRGGHEICFTSRERLEKDFLALANILRVIGEPVMAGDFLNIFLRRIIWASDAGITSRERFELYRGAAAITYLQKIEVEIPKDVAARLLAEVTADLGRDETVSE